MEQSAAQTGAIGGESDERENGLDKPRPSPTVADSCVKGQCFSPSKRAT